jgi:hypothetical protein
MPIGTFSIRLASVAAALLGLSLAGSAAFAQVDATRLSAAQTAAVSFVRMAEGSEKTGQMPRETDTRVRRLMEIVFDASDVTAGKPVSRQDIRVLNERLAVGLQVGVLYLLAGTGISEFKDAPDARTEEAMNRNLVSFAPELGRYFDFQVRMFGALSVAVMAEIADGKPEQVARPAFQKYIETLRVSNVRTFLGIAQAFTMEVGDEWRRGRLPALAEVAPTMAKFLTPELKQAMKELAEAVIEEVADPEVKRSMQAFAAAVMAGA